MCNINYIVRWDIFALSDGTSLRCPVIATFRDVCALRRVVSCVCRLVVYELA